MQRKKGQKRKIQANTEDENDNEIVFNLPKKAKIEEPRRSPNGYILPDPLPQGLVLTDLKKQRWKLGKSVGLGGFGEIYSAAFLNGNKSSKEEYVIKVEPHTNGPLFVELHFYCRSTKISDLSDFKTQKNLSHLGIPDMKGHGSFIFNSKKLRFIVLPRYASDLQTLIDKSQILSIDLACSVANQVVDCFEYLYLMGYVHKDLKGSNLIFERNNKKNGSKSREKIYLIDYGLTSRIHQRGLHKPFEPDQRSAHEGTLEYTSRDAHLGCVSRRGDVEVLLYNLIDWLGGKLPWDVEESLKPSAIQSMKIEAFHDIKIFLSSVFKGKDYPGFLEDLMTYLKKMRFEETPDYDFLRSLFRPYLGFKEVLEVEEEDEEVKINKPLMRKPSKRRSLPLNLKRQQSVSVPWTPGQLQVYTDKKNEIIQNICEESLKNPTPPMQEQLARMQKRQIGQMGKGSPSVLATSTTRRKRMVAKRRLIRPGEAGEPPVKGNASLLKKEVAGRLLPVRKSPRKFGAGSDNAASLGQHLYGIVGNLVKSMFQINSQQN